MDETLDRIDKSIDIDAGVDRVWELVSTPGWFVNDGAVSDHRIEQRDGYVLVHDDKHGTLPFRIVERDPQRYVAYRWLSGTGDDDTALDDQSTLVEFWISERPGGVTLRVVESGFANLSVPERERRSRFEENTSGWDAELAAARDHLAAQRATSA